MFDIGWSEIAIIAMIALVVIGPKDLPKVLKTIGQWVGKARAITREFQKGVEDVIKESELDEVRDQINSVKDFSIEDQVKETVDPDAELADAFDVTMDENMEETAVEEKPAPEKDQTAKKSAAKAKSEASQPLAASEKPTIAAPEEAGETDKDKA